MAKLRSGRLGQEASAGGKVRDDSHCTVFAKLLCTGMPSNCLHFVCSCLLFCSCGCSALLTPPHGANEPEGQRRLLSFDHWQEATQELGLSRQKQPKHHKLWRPDLAVLPYAQIESDRVWLYNIRDCEYRTEEDYDVRHIDRLIYLSDVRTIDFIVVPFSNAPMLAHTMLSFGLANGEQIVFSVEARLETGEGYELVAGTTNEYELMWVVGTERDLIRLRTEVRDVDVYLYRTRATPEQVQRVFLAALARVNEIARQPEFYDLLNNNCTTNIVDLINQLRPGAIPKDIRVVLPGHSDRLAYDLGLLAVEGPFEQIKAGSKINLLANLNAHSPNFSQAIRQR